MFISVCIKLQSDTASERLISLNKIARSCFEELLEGNDDFIYSVSCHLSRHSNYTYAPRNRWSLLA